ncbi:MAG: hypothetical protein GTO18_08240 [Anaerolineales bacterium]|nr:hypothetical protein [Anaerolineales bacterium]
MKRFLIFHPWLFALFSPISMYAHNLGEIAFSGAVRSMLFSLAIAVLLLLVVRIIVKDWLSAAVLTSLILVFLFSYGHVYSIMKQWRIGGFIIGRHRFLLPVGTALLVIVLILVVRKVRDWVSLNRLFNVMGFAALLLPIFAIGAYSLESNSISSSFETQDLDLYAPARESFKEDLPDIYYIILDGYARSDVLAELYDYDNTSFEAFLAANGFYVAKNSTSNYAQTHLSLASSLNMKYLDGLVVAIGEDATNVRPLGEMVRNSEVRAHLTDFGYRTVSFESGYGLMEVGNADIYLRSGGDPTNQNILFFLDASINAFESQFIETTLFRALIDLQILMQSTVQQSILDPAYATHRNRILYIFDRLTDIPAMEGHHFVFVHIIAPHPPFVFGPNGEEVRNLRAYSLADGDYYVGSPDYLSGYRDQLVFINTMLERAITEILEESTIAPVILLQADHGPGAYLEWRDPDVRMLKERMSILSAYHLSDRAAGMLYETITPVNSFRVVFNGYFGFEFPLLKDENFYSLPGHPYKLLPVTEEVQP